MDNFKYLIFASSLIFCSIIFFVIMNKRSHAEKIKLSALITKGYSTSLYDYRDVKLASVKEYIKEEYYNMLIETNQVSMFYHQSTIKITLSEFIGEKLLNFDDLSYILKDEYQTQKNGPCEILILTNEDMENLNNYKKNIDILEELPAFFFVIIFFSILLGPIFINT